MGRSEVLVVPVVSLGFALGGVLDNMKEEIIALVPVTLLLLARRYVVMALTFGAVREKA